MTSYTAVLPWIYKPWRDACMKTCRLDVYEVDNRQVNRGVMRSHNLGVDHMREHGNEWLVIMSAALRFGPAGGLDFIDQLDSMNGHQVVESAGVYGWHLIAFHRSTLDVIGRWDPNFSPYGFDDLDMSVRYQLAFGVGGQLWDKVPVDVKDAGMGHSIKRANVAAPAQPLIDYFMAKWGRHPSASDRRTYRRPFNDSTNPIGFWPEYEGEAWSP
jgi:hypothetical protein